MRRREFLIGSALAAWPMTSRAQRAMPVVGFLNGSSADGYAPMVSAFHQGLKEVGYVEGQNLAIEFRWANGQYDQLPILAADLVRRKVSVIAATGTPANLVAKTATNTIPIVFTTATDPVHLGLVASLGQPGGNVTGATQLGVEVGPKRLELAHELIPDATDIALLVNPDNPSAATTLLKDAQGAAFTFGLQLHVLRARTEREIEAAFASFGQLRAGVLVIGTDSFFNGQSKRLAALALQHSVPAIYQFGDFTSAGGLISYGGSIKESYRLAGIYTGRILNGDKPAELPVQRSTKIELIINLKTAKALGVTVPQPLLARVDEVIE
jgi:putative ABC transport system substrate-binding protein